MKPYIIYSALTAMTFVAVGCEQLDYSDPTPPDVMNDVLLNFNVNINANGLRQTRKLESSDCAQHVTDMRIYVFRSTTGVGDASFTYYRPQVEGATAPQDYFKVEAFDKIDPITGHTPEEQVYTIKPVLPTGYYRFIAVGRDDDNGTPEDNITLNWDSNTTWNDALISTSAPRLSGEVFTGYPRQNDNTPRTFQVGRVTGFSATIDLYRAVAGVLLYVENIPDALVSDYSWNGTDAEVPYTLIEQGKEYAVDEIAVVAPGYNSTMNILTRHWTENSFVAEDRAFSTTRLVSIPMADIRANQAGTKDADGYYNISRRLGSFVLPSQLKGRKVELTYVPDDEDAPEVTYTFPSSMYLAFFTEIDGKHYPIKMLSVVDNGQTPHMPGGPSFYTSSELAVERTQYNLICNNIYCLGDYRTEGGDPIDEPINLKEALNKPELNITVIGNWQADVDINL